MKTNQMMEVPIGDFGIINIGHKTKMGKAKDVLEIGNLIRDQRGLRPIKIDEILRKQDFWEFVIELNIKKLQQNQDVFQTPDSGVWINANYSNLIQYKNTDGHLKYQDLINQFPSVIKSQRGGNVDNRGHWMDLMLLLKLATYLDKKLEVEIYDCFIKGKILDLRDESGDNFKQLCSVLNKNGLIEDNEDYEILSRSLKIFILGERHEGVDVWNTIATKEQLAERDKMELYLINIINDGLVKSFNDCLSIIARNNI